MNSDHLPPTHDDALLQRYREANEFDTARPGAALRENVLTHARAAAASRIDTARREARPAANDSVWAWRALGSIAVMGLVGLLVLHFDRGTPEEKDLALGTGTSRPAAETATSIPPLAPAAAPAIAPADPAESAAAQPQSPQPVAQQQAPEAAAPAPGPASPRRSKALTPEAADRMARAEAPQEPEAMAPAASAEVTPEPQAPAAAVAPAPVAKAMAPQAPAPMARAAPAEGAAAPAFADAAAPSGASRNAAEGMLRERREIAGTRPAPQPLFAAIASGDAEVVGQRLAEGSDPNGPDATGRTPLIAAARTGNEAVVRRLLAAGADRTLRDRDGLSAADHAERSGHPGLLPLLR
jgi:Ankyrin repeats (3 copies)